MQVARGSVPELVRLFDSGSAVALSEEQILERYIVHRDERAFESLVASHGPMVLGVCRRQLGCSPAVDDAFQATFLVLIRRAATLNPSITLGAWLHGVAVRVAKQARKKAYRAEVRERPGLPLEAIPVRDRDAADPDLCRVLDEEIARLPDRYRLPVVLCYLEGLTHEEAARRLGWPLGSVKGRLSRARNLLRSRLTRRGVAGGVGAAALAGGGYAEASMPLGLIQATCKSLLSSGTAPALGVVPAVSQPVLRLVEGVAGTMILSKIRLLAVAAGVSGLFLAGVGATARQPISPERRTVGKAVVPVDASPSAGKADVKRPSLATGVADPAAPEAPRSEITQLEKEALNAARESYRVVSEQFKTDKLSVGAEQVHNASRLLLDTELQLARTKVERDAAFEGHRDRMREVARIAGEGGAQTGVTAAETRAFFALAALQAERARSSQAAEPDSPTRPADLVGSGAPGEVGRPGGNTPTAATGSGANGAGQGRRDANSDKVLAKLEDPIPMNFPNETPLEDVLKYIGQATAGPEGAGIPIYVDPLGLQQADKTVNSTVSMNLEGVPLKHTLRLMLRELGLAYTVKDGFLMITAEDAEFSETELSKKRERVERGELTVEELKPIVEELKLRRDALQLFDAPIYRDAPPRGEDETKGQSAEIRQQLKEMKELLQQIRSERADAGKKADVPKPAR
ncbi:ECF RNA polymerase sigma factor SigE [Aquisphaera giovannonii]|uniref:ECF RNA polymerase sigma factor SigE n=1 Tax=Aquisphaera giovannonii TaxID=406548 RepID=A0A5B9VZZ5_9BACT|nr:sigma-70 family RNA polymerase sigma factor [Aquisphaera giovannonii]QEH33524.1 ECF RNA polymerase sigma factor SigE [Aquisphaera giovannonii]